VASEPRADFVIPALRTTLCIVAFSAAMHNCEVQAARGNGCLLGYTEVCRSKVLSKSPQKGDTHDTIHWFGRTFQQLHLWRNQRAGETAQAPDGRNQRKRSDRVRENHTQNALSMHGGGDPKPMVVRSVIAACRGNDRCATQEDEGQQGRHPGRVQTSGGYAYRGSETDIQRAGPIQKVEELDPYLQHGEKRHGAYSKPNQGDIPLLRHINVGQQRVYQRPTATVARQSGTGASSINRDIIFAIRFGARVEATSEGFVIRGTAATRYQQSIEELLRHGRCPSGATDVGSGHPISFPHQATVMELQRSRGDYAQQFGLGKDSERLEIHREGHLDDMVRGSVESTLNSLLDAEADQLCNAHRLDLKELVE
jgi:hypothetical protein